MMHVRSGIYLNYSQEELDRAYDQRVWAQNAEEAIARFAQSSSEVRIGRRCMDFRYGDAADETLYVFPTAAPKAPMHIHLHGGAWRSLSKDDACFPAPSFVDAGIHFVVPNFTNLPENRLPGMVEQVRRAIGWVHTYAAQFDGDPDSIYLSGHSSGAHLAAVMLTTEWSAHKLPPDLIKGGLCVSGMYDLEPVLLSARREYLKLNAEECDALSPLKHIDRIRCPVSVAVGSRESPEFIRQARDFASALVSSGRHAGLIVEPDLDHFEIAQELACRESVITRAALAQVRRPIPVLAD